jgi:AcrR family transcriptional regulator
MNTREQIIETANNLLIERGFNGFSYKNIAELMCIKTSSIHYHFPTKTDLGIAIIQMHRDILEQVVNESDKKTPLEKMNRLFLYYKQLAAEKKVCIVGSLTSDINTLDGPLREELLKFAKEVTSWAALILDEGQSQQIFKHMDDNKLKAKLILTNLLALVQMSRIENSKHSFDSATQLLLDEIIIK